jgi:hypothetical protein
MKKLFNHTKRPDRNWEEDVQDGYDWDEEQDGGEYYADDEEYTDEEYTDEEYTGDEDGGEYYADDEEYTGDEDGGEYYADDEEYTGEEDGGEYYADDEEYTDEEQDGEEYYADDEEYTGEEDGEEYYADDEEYIGDEDSEEYYAGDEEYYADDDMAPARGGKRKKSKKQGGNKIAAIWTKFLNMSTMDRIMTATGVAVLILAIVTGSVYASARMVDHQVSEFVSVGSQLDGIQMIGEQGMLAVADASNIVVFGNAPFADDRGSSDNLASLIAKETGATVYNCSISGSYLAAQHTNFDSTLAPMDAYCLYWLVNLAAGVPLDGYYNDAAEALGDKTPPEAEEVVNTLKTLDFNTIDTVAIMYDATDYLMGNAMYNDDNPTDPTQFTGNLEASLEVLQRLYPQIRIIVMSPTYAYAIDEDGNYVSSDIYIYNGRDVLSTYVIKECYSSNLHSVSFMDNLYGSITEDNAKEYLTDNLHLNVKGRKLIAKRFEYFLNYYSKGYASQE